MSSRFAAVVHSEEEQGEQNVEAFSTLNSAPAEADAAHGHGEPADGEGLPPEGTQGAHVLPPDDEVCGITDPNSYKAASKRLSRPRESASRSPVLQTLMARHHVLPRLVSAPAVVYHHPTLVVTLDSSTEPFGLTRLPVIHRR